MDTGRLRDIVAAVADGEAVEWKALRDSPRGADPVVGNLEILSRIAAGRRSDQGLPALRVGPVAFTALAWWETLLLLVAGLRSLAAIFIGLSSLPASGRDLHLGQIAFTASCLVAGLVLLRGAPGDRRAVTLAGILITSAGATASPIYARRLLEPGVASFDPLAFLTPDALLAWWFWSFVSVFPRRVVEGAGDRLSAAGRLASLLWGLVLLAANAVLTMAPSTAPLLRWFARSGGFGFWGVVGTLLLTALAAMVFAARRAEPAERRKAAFFMGAVAAGFGPLFLIEVSASFLRSGPASSRQLTLELLPTLTVPFTTAWGVLARRILPARDLLHQAARHLIARATVGASVGFPVIGVVVLLVTHRDRPVAEALSGAAGQGLALLTSLLLPIALWRRPLLALVDRRFNREAQDWAAHLAALTRALVGADRPEDVMRALETSVAKPLGAESVDVLRLGEDARLLVSSRDAGLSLSPEAGPALLAFESDEPFEIDPALETSGFWWLPEADRRWILDARAGLLLPLRSGDRPMGLLVLGPRRAERAYESEEIQFLRAVGAVVASGLDRVAAPPAVAPAPLFECVACGRLMDGAERCACGGEARPSRLPRLLAGRYSLDRRVGEGGMGRVYRATDVDLGRPVALKTLPAVSAEASIRLRQEARAMAGVSHPNLAVLYGIERHDGAPVLVAEFMARGTLADRLTTPMSVDEAIRVGVAVASALEALHAASFIHRDVKPSNIGFSDRDEPKLLDLGLADAAFRVPPPEAPLMQGPTLPSFAGTPRYAPPEAWVGDPAGPEGDLWALAMTLYECLAGRHPLAGIPFREWPEALLAPPPVTAVRSDCPRWLSDYLAAGLSAEPGRRWASASDVLQALRTFAGPPFNADEPIVTPSRNNRGKDHDQRCNQAGVQEGGPGAVDVSGE